jgi:hypothetical protein
LSVHSATQKHGPTFSRPGLRPVDGGSSMIVSAASVTLK